MKRTQSKNSVYNTHMDDEHKPTIQRRRLFKPSKQPMKKTRMPNSSPERPFEAHDHIQAFTPDGLPRHEVMLGVYGSEEWIMCDNLRSRHLRGVNTVQIDITWLVPSAFKLAEWAAANAKKFSFMSANRVLIQHEHGIMKMTIGRGKLEVENIGDPEWVMQNIAHFDAQYKRAENMIEWVYSTNGHSIDVPLNFRPAIKAAYPWIKKDLTEYIDDYINSDASVIILIGPPGTGKTTFIKNLIHRSGADAKVAYDENVMNGDGLFAGFIDDDSRFLIMEDADNFLQSRKEGNSMMHKFLNVSDGLISAADKKMVFSTNLPNRTDIDEALMRPGRCYDVLEFRPLTLDEAQAVIDETNTGKIPEGKDKFTLAELFSQQPSAAPRRKTMGFTS